MIESGRQRQREKCKADRRTKQKNGDRRDQRDVKVRYKARQEDKRTCNQSPGKVSVFKLELSIWLPDLQDIMY